jgi:hypothetical protein
LPTAHMLGPFHVNATPSSHQSEGLPSQKRLKSSGW